MKQHNIHQSLLKGMVDKRMQTIDTSIETVEESKNQMYFFETLFWNLDSGLK